MDHPRKAARGFAPLEQARRHPRMESSPSPILKTQSAGRFPSASNSRILVKIFTMSSQLFVMLQSTTEYWFRVYSELCPS